jgi:hypothetical protein
MRLPWVHPLACPNKASQISAKKLIVVALCTQGGLKYRPSPGLYYFSSTYILLLIFSRTEKLKYRCAVIILK